MARSIKVLSFLCVSWTVLQFCSGELIVIDGEPVRRVAIESNSVHDSMNSVDDLTLGKNLNEIVDFLIHMTQDILQKTGRATIKVPDISEEFSKRIHHFIKIKGKFTAENGWFKDLSSVHRTGDATLTHSGGNITASVALGLQTLQLGFDHYRVKVEHLISVSGKIKAEAGSNSVLARVNVMMLKTGKCNLTLEELKITKLDGLKVHVEGKIKPVNWVLSKIATSVIKHMKDKIVHQVESHLSEAVNKALDKYHC